MRGCLGDEALWRVHEGEGSLAEQTHLARCPGCRARSRRLARDLRVIRSVLVGPAPVRLARGRARWPRSRLLPIAAAILIVSAAGVGGSLWGRWQPGRVHPAPARGEETLAFLGDVSAALFAPGDESPMTATPDPALADLEAALDGDGET